MGKGKKQPIVPPPGKPAKKKAASDDKRDSGESSGGGGASDPDQALSSAMSDALSNAVKEQLPNALAAALQQLLGTPEQLAAALSGVNKISSQDKEDKADPDPEEDATKGSSEEDEEEEDSHSLEENRRGLEEAARALHGGGPGVGVPGGPTDSPSAIVSPHGLLLPDMDKISKHLSRRKSHKPLRGLVGDDRVSDIIYRINRLMEQCETVGLVSASGNWTTMASRKDPKKDSPIEGSSSKKYSVLHAERLKLEKLLNDRSMIDSGARRGHAADHFLPPFMTNMAAELILDMAAFSCAFDKYVWAQFSQNDQYVQQFREGLERFLNLSPEKYSVLDTYNLLIIVRDKMAISVNSAINRGNDQSKLMSKAQRLTQAQPSATMLAEAMKLAQHQATEKKKPLGRKQSPADDGAMDAFVHNPNPAQDKAAAVEANARSARKRMKLESMPSEDPVTRSKTIREAICKFHWMPNKECSRDACRFAQVSQAETRAMGIEDEEVASALK